MVDVIAALDADVLLLQGFDVDGRHVSLGRFVERLAAAGARYPFRFAFASNRGLPSGQDLDDDGRSGGPGDAQGFGRFRGAGGMALLSRLPVLPDRARDFSALLWRDLPDSGAPPDSQIAGAWRLSSGGHWEVPLRRADGSILRLLAFHASPPVFGAADGRNRRRNRDEIRFWKLFLDGWAPDGGPGARPPFVIAGVANLDPEDGAGDREAVRDLLGDSRLHDLRPVSEGGRLAPRRGVDARHRGEPAQDTAIFDSEQGPGRLRLDYLLPSADLTVLGSGVFWPAPGQPLADETARASRHRPVWIDIE